MRKRMQTDFEEIKETNIQLPSSRCELEEDMLEQICLIANAGAEITVEELCGRMNMSRREVNFCLKQLKNHGYVVGEKETYIGLQGKEAESGIFLTELGKITGEEFQYRHEILRQFLQFVGVSEEKAEEDACRMEHVISEETVHQMSRNSETRISMAHQGFEHLALIRNNTRGSWLELTIREVNGRSRIDGTRMWGHISSLKYEKQGQLYEAVIKDGHLKIPLSACHFFRGRMGNVKGTVHITVACNIGNAHMPESTAVLTFWM